MPPSKPRNRNRSPNRKRARAAAPPPAPVKRARKARPRNRLPPPSLRRRNPTPSILPVIPSSPTPGEARATQRLFERIPEDELRAALETCDDERAQRLLAVLDDPIYRRTAATGGTATGGTASGVNMSACIRAAGMSVPEVLKAIMSMHSADADLRVARRLPDIMEQMAAESAPRLVPCPQCQESARSVDEAVANVTADVLTDATAVRCRRCRNRGVIIQDADNDVRKMLLEAAGKLGVRGPLVDARSVTLVNGRNARDVGAPDMTDWSRTTDTAFEAATPQPMLPPAADVRDAEIIES